MKNLVFLLSVLILLGSTYLLAQDDLAMAKKQIIELTDKYEKATLSGDFKSIFNFYTEDAISLPDHYPMQKGKDAIKKFYEMDSKEKITAFNLETKDVFGSGDWFYQIGTYTITIEIPQMKEPINDHGKFLIVFKKEDGSLKVSAETWNSDMKPMAGMMEGSDTNKMK